MDCPCGAGAAFDACCQPIIKGEREPPTAEVLMRARYSAYATGAVEFIEASHDPRSDEQFDREATATWSKKSEWLGFEMGEVEGGGEDDDQGSVEFTARYRMNGQEYAHHETAKFERVEGRWVFIDGEMASHETFQRTTPKVGRNEPCPCGSGKKYKKCHGAAGTQAPA